jgi:hypothetical protein
MTVPCIGNFEPVRLAIGESGSVRPGGRDLETRRMGKKILRDR